MIKKSSKLKNNSGQGWENCVPPRFEKKTKRILPCHDVGEFESGFTKIRLADLYLIDDRQNVNNQQVEKS